MSWFADLAGKAENLLNNLDEQTGVALRNHNVSKTKNKHERRDYAPHPEPSWTAPGKKRPLSRSQKKIAAVTESKSNSIPLRKASPISSHRSPTKELIQEPIRCRKSPVRRTHHYTLDNAPETMVGDIHIADVIDNHYPSGAKSKRRYSLPSDLELLNNDNALTSKIQNLEVENAMLKNELNVMNREVSELLDRLRKTEDDLSKCTIKNENLEVLNKKLNIEKDSMTTQIEQLQIKLKDITGSELNRYKEQNRELETEVSVLRDRAKDLEEKVIESNAAHTKLENELRHAQSIIDNLQNNLEKSTAECQRLEKDWESYKLRVKSMLYSKDSEIKSLQEGVSYNEDTKSLVEQLESLKQERNELSEAISRVRGECGDMKHCIEQVESRYSAAEKIVTALRDALREERMARSRAESQVAAVAKELKTMQIETGQTIASLRTALRDKENELNHLHNTTSSSVRTTDTSALNVADYDVIQDTIDNDKIKYLTQALVQKQGKIDSLLADNNMLRIQMDKLESRYKTELSTLRTNTHSHTHSVHVSDDVRPRSRNANTNKHYIKDSVLSRLSVKLGVVIKRYPLLRIFIIIYMIGLHLWVLTVLLTSTPEDFIQRHSVPAT